MDTVSGPIQIYVPLVGGIGALIWLIWRLFWKVDRRSQQDLAIKDAEIAKLTAEVDKERALRFLAQERASKAESREQSLESQISDLSDQIKELRSEVERLRGTTAKICKGKRTKPKCYTYLIESPERIIIGGCLIGKSLGSIFCFCYRIFICVVLFSRV